MGLMDCGHFQIVADIHVLQQFIVEIKIDEILRFLWI